jgi:hypothetical protein
MNIIKDESGQAAIVAVLSLTIFFLGFVGFATDVGVLLHAKRNLQIVADAAALAGANEIRISAASASAPSVSAAGTAAAAQNGVSCAGCVTINNPPLSGPHTGNPAYVEAIVIQAQPTFFMRLFSFTSMPVAARAVAFNGASIGSGCLNAIGSGPDVIQLQGHFNVDAPGCQVLDESNDPSALDFTGNAGTLTAGSVGVVGGVKGFATDSTPPPVTGIKPVGDPLAGLVSPIPQSSWPACTAPPSGGTWGTSGGTTYQGGMVYCYSGNISVSTTITMNAGTYIFTGSLGLQGHGVLQDNGAGVTIYLAGPNGNMNMSGAGNASLSLTAPASGPYPNIVIYEEPTDTNPVNMEGTPITTLSGIVYLPSAELELGGNGTLSQNLNVDLVVNKLYDFGNADVNITDYSAGTTTILDTIALVE